ncbi:hypothetical protein [Fodinicurvata sediminis]|uniref:hypothetical protein n=1 Tax=Fodinicurvata sediminis TaxID=1121832 RepID=UPI0012DC2FC5|nr:hypothetical protein [Fodinicurvata sediminis]
MMGALWSAARTAFAWVTSGAGQVLGLVAAGLLVAYRVWRAGRTRERLEQKEREDESREKQKAAADRYRRDGGAVRRLQRKRY